MEKRKWIDVTLAEPELLRLRTARRTRQEIADELALSNAQIEN